MENEVLKAIRERRSIRRYKPEQITDEELRTVLEAGTWAATGMGKQDPWIVAVQNPEVCDRLRKMNAVVMGTDSDPYMARLPSCWYSPRQTGTTTSRTLPWYWAT